MGYFIVCTHANLMSCNPQESSKDSITYLTKAHDIVKEGMYMCTVTVLNYSTNTCRDLAKAGLGKHGSHLIFPFMYGITLFIVKLSIYRLNYKKLIKLQIVGGDTYQEGLACYRLGNAYEGIGEHDVAIQVHPLFMFCFFRVVYLSLDR